MIGYLSDGNMTRHDYNDLALRMAFTPFVKPEMYQEEQQQTGT